MIFSLSLTEFQISGADDFFDFDVFVEWILDLSAIWSRSEPDLLGRKSFGGFDLFFFFFFME